MKKDVIYHIINCLLLSLFVSVLLTACGGSGEDEPPLPTTRTQQDSLALLKINTGSVKWTQTAKMDNWQGVRIRQVDGERRVVYLDLHNSQISGKIPAELNELTALEYLDLSENNLSDNIPVLSALSNLQILDLHDNDLTGILSDNITRLQNLTYLSLSRNLFFSDVPAGISSLSKLVVLDLSKQKRSLSEPGFSGNLPSSWSSLKELQYLHLHENAFTGTIPQYLTTLSKMVSLTLNDNNFTGSIPEGFGQIGSLENISMRDNSLTGNIPSDLLLNPNWERWKDQIIIQNGSNLDMNGETGSTRTSKTEEYIEYPLPDKHLFYQYK